MSSPTRAERPAYTAELAAARDAARSAGDVIMALYVAFTPIPDAPADISTAADRHAQDVILDHLQQGFPGDAVCAEEQTRSLAGLPRAGSRLWVVDPIDGTRGFARKNGEFAVMIGLVVEGAAVLGVVLEPARARLTYAVRGHGCWRDDGRSDLALCSVSAIQSLEEATAIRSRGELDDPRGSSNVPVGRVVYSYSAGIKLAMVARGEADLYVRRHQFHSWDLCAGQILVEEAGGRVTDAAGGVIHYGADGAAPIHGVVATNGRVQLPIGSGSSQS